MPPRSSFTTLDAGRLDVYEFHGSLTTEVRSHDRTPCSGPRLVTLPMSGPIKARHLANDATTPGWPESPSQREVARRKRAERRERRSEARAERPERAQEQPQPKIEPGRGDRWNVWIDNREQLYRRCLGWTNGNTTEAEDLLGQLLMRVLRVESSELEQIKCPRAWMTRILRHLYVDHVRGNWRAHAHDVEIERSLHAGPGPDPSAEVWRSELSEALRLAIDALPSSLRGPLVQRYIEGLDYQHIARCHDITPPTARKRCQLARDRIRQSLKATI